MSVLKGRTALITGAGSGIGKSLVHVLLDHGVCVGACGRDIEKLESLREQAGSHGSNLIIGSVDVRDPQQLSGFAAKIALTFGTVDTLIANAGLGVFGPVEKLTSDDYDTVMDINVRGVFLSVQAVLPGMIQQGSGDILIIGSLASKNGFAGGAVYAASKFAVRGMAQSMMLDLREKGIRVMTVFPGSVDTPFFDGSSFEPNRDKILQADDVAAAVIAMLGSDARAMISELDIRPSNPR